MSHVEADGARKHISLVKSRANAVSREAALIVAVGRLIDGVDRKRRTVSEQGCLCDAVESCECIPEIVSPFGNRAFQDSCRVSTAFADALSGRLSREDRRAKSDLKAASGRCEPVKGHQHEVVQHRLERNRRIFCQRIPQCQRAMCCQFGDEPIRQRFRRVLIIFFGISSAAGHDDRALDGSTTRLPLDRLCIAVLPDVRISCRQVVLRPDITRSTERRPWESILTKTPARVISAGS